MMASGTPSKTQDKAKEIAFFDRHAQATQEYDVFTPRSSERLIAAFNRLTGLGKGAYVADLGCGSGAFTNLLRQAGYNTVGVDISPKLIEVGRARYPGLDLRVGDVEELAFASGSFDGVLLSGIVHHLPDPSRCAGEVFRVLRHGGRFLAFDPNRRNPFMWLYRDRTSPFYSSLGVTENERPVIASEIVEAFRRAGFTAGSDFLSGLAYRYVESAGARRLLPAYNLIDRIAFAPAFMRPFRAFVLTWGEKT